MSRWQDYSRKLENTSCGANLIHVIILLMFLEYASLITNTPGAFYGYLQLSFVIILSPLTIQLHNTKGYLSL
jgi:hypothetical protein